MSPRTIDPTLRTLLERENPNVCVIAELTAPDVSDVLRRWDDQFSVNPPRLSETPGASTQATASGALTLKSADALLASRYVSNGTYLVGVPDVSKVVKGVAWTPDPTLGRVRLTKATVRIQRKEIYPTIPAWMDASLQIYRPTAVVGQLVRQEGTSTITQEAKQWSFPELLPTPAIARNASVAWDGSQTGDVTFDLRPYALDVGPLIDPPTGASVIQRPYYLFVVDPVMAPPRSFIFDWKIDTTTPITVAGVGTFRETTWSRPNTDDALGWSEQVQPYAETLKLYVESYEPTSQEVYSLAMRDNTGLAASPVAASVGRVVFEAPTPAGTSATLEISTAGSGGPWTAVTNGTEIATHQATYHLRLTMNASADTYRAPWVPALGLEFRIPVDVSAEAKVEPLSKEISVPFLEAAIGEGKLGVVRAGQRNYRDVATDFAAMYPTSKLEVDLWLASRHPQVTRAMWFLMDRAAVSTRTPTPTAEQLPLLSVAKRLKRKIPERIEAINSVHTVTGVPTEFQVQVTPNLPTADVTGLAYDGKGYYMRVRSSLELGLGPGYIQTIDGNTNVDKMDFAASTPLPGVFAVGDVVEVHSGTFAQPALSWVDTDPAVIWWEILTQHLAIPPERIGRGDVGRAGRAGLPPYVTDRSADAATQNKLKVTFKITKAENADELLDQVSQLMGGATVEIGGQIVFRQIYPLKDENGVTVIAAETPAAVFDPRDFFGLDCPTGVEQRLTTIACDYGVDLTAASQDTQATKTTVYADGDAVEWLATQDVDGLGYAEVPSEISRWCYNSADFGLYLAMQVAKQVVQAASTGLRVWSWTSRELRPELTIGDTVTLITDQYTDYDPARRLSIRGTWAYSLVIIAITDGGRRFRGYMLGLSSATQITGGAGTTPGIVPAQPSINADFDAGGNLIASLNMGLPAGAGFRVAATTPGVPSDAAVEAAAYVAGQTATVNLGGGWGSGAVVHVKAFAYASSDTASAKSIASTADAVAPSASVTPAVTSVSVTGQNDTTDDITVAWTVANAPGGATYDLIWSKDNRATTDTIPGVTTPYTHAKLGAHGHGFNITVGGDIAHIWYSVVMKSAGVQVAQSGWIVADVDHA